MRCSSRWALALTVGLLLALVMPVAAPAFAGSATPLPQTAASAPAGSHAPAAPQAWTTAEIILIEGSGRIRVDEPFPQPNTKPFTWDSGSDVGWQNIAVGNFDGDTTGYKEIVAVRGSELKVFQLLPAPTVLLDTFTPIAGSYRLLTTGDFDGDGKDEIVATYYPYSNSSSEYVLVYDLGGGGWTSSVLGYYGAEWMDIGSGDLNQDGIGDLVLVRRPDHLVKVYLGVAGARPAWQVLPDDKTSGFPWRTLAIGKLALDYTGEQLAITRDLTQGATNSMILYRLIKPTATTYQLRDVTPGGALSTRWEPPFSSIAPADVNGDGDKELVLLRDPIVNKAALKVYDSSRPAGGQYAPGYEASIGCSSGCTVGAWSKVRAGDLNGDGRDEFVVLRADRYRMYGLNAAGNSYITLGPDVSGGFYIPTATMFNTTGLLVANLDGVGIPNAPALKLSTNTLDFMVDNGQAVAPQSFTISNSANDLSFNWSAQVTTGADWIHLDRASGTASQSAPATVQVSVDSAAAPIGVKTGTIRVTGAGAAQSPQDITVKLTVRGPVFSVSPALVALGDVPYGVFSESLPVNITNSGTVASLGWQASIIEGASWLRIGSSGGGTPYALYVWADTTRAALGSNSGTIKIMATDPGVPDPVRYVSVTLNVTDPGFLVLPTSVSLWQQVDAAAPTAQIQVLKLTGGNVDWSASAFPGGPAGQILQQLKDGVAKVTAAGVEINGQLQAAPAWLSFDPASGQAGPGLNSTITIHVDPSKAQVGLNQARLLVVPVSGPTREVLITYVLAERIYQSHTPLVMH